MDNEVLPDPCPFCSGQSIIQLNPKKEGWIVYCADCYYQAAKLTKDAVFKAWKDKKAREVFWDRSEY